MTLLEVLPSLRRAATPRIDRAIWPLTTSVDEVGRLCVGGVPLTAVADEYRTPTYVLDEADVRHRMRRYRSALPGVDVVYAGKSLLTVAVARWVAEEGLGLDVCSGGELATALAGGVDPARIIMHGNAKTPDELRDAATVEVGPDCGGLAASRSPSCPVGCAGRQQVLVRVTPDIDIHGHAAVSTGVIDQKFGFALAGGHAAAAVRRVLDQPMAGSGRPALPHRLASHRCRALRRGHPPDDRRVSPVSGQATTSSSTS